MMPENFGAFINVASPAALIVLALITWFKTIPQLRKIRADGDMAMRSDLMRRIEVLEEQAARNRIDREIERKEHEAEIQVLRHRLNNETHALDTLLILLEQNPDRIKENIGRIKGERERMRLEIAAEKGAIAANRINSRGEN